MALRHALPGFATTRKAGRYCMTPQDIVALACGLLGLGLLVSLPVVLAVRRSARRVQVYPIQHARPGQPNQEPANPKNGSERGGTIDPGRA